MKRNNKGFSLVELIVAFAIAAIAGAAVYSMMSFSNNSFRNSSKDLGLQYEQQIVVNQIRDYILESSDAISYDSGSKSLFVYSADSETETTSSGVVVEKPFVDVTQLKFDSAAGEIYFRTTKKEAEVTSSGVVMPITGSGASAFTGSGADFRLLASKVKDISYDLSEVEDKNKVTFTITFYADEKELSSTQVVSLRNTIKNNGELGEIYDTTREEVNSFITGIVIKRDGENITSGTDEIGMYGSVVTVHYDATVLANQYSHMTYGVSWVVDTANPAITVGPSTGDVQILCDQVSDGETFVLTAISVDDPTKKTSITVTIKNDLVYPQSAKLTAVDLSTVVYGNGYMELNFIPEITYTGLIPGITPATNKLYGDAALDRILEWEITGDEIPGVKYGIVSGIDQETGKLRLSYEANGRHYVIRYSLKQRKADGTICYSNTVSLDVDGISPYKDGTLLSLVAPDQVDRGGTFNAAAMWTSNSDGLCDYFWKVVPYQDNSSGKWSSETVGKALTDFDLSVSIKSDSAVKPYTGDFSEYGSLAEYVYDGKGDVYVQDDEGNDILDEFESAKDDEYTSISTGGWYKCSDPRKIISVTTQHYLDWNNPYKYKILMFAVSKNGSTLYDNAGARAITTSSRLTIVPIEKVVNVPKVQFILTPRNYCNNEYRYSTNPAQDKYKEFRTTDTLQTAKYWPGERRVFYYSAVGLYLDASHSPLKNWNNRDYTTTYVFWKDGVEQPSIAKNYTKPKDNYYGDRTAIIFNIDIRKGNGNYDNNGEYFNNYSPNKMQFYITVNWSDTVNFNGTNVTLNNSAESNRFDYKLVYRDYND